MAELNAFDLVKDAQQSVPVNLGALARQLGVELDQEAMEEDVSGYIHHTEGRWRIAVNSNHARTRQRFTIAHELGHYVLHRNRLGRGTNDTRAYRVDATRAFYNSAIERKHERQANQFAAALLMPEDMVVSVHNIYRNNDPEMMAKFFGVSPAAMRIRLEYLEGRGRF